MTAVIRIDVLGDSRSGVRAANQTANAYDRLGRGADKSSSKVGKLGGALGAAAKRYGPLAALAAAGGVLKIGADSIQAASHVQQAFGAIDAVFGKNSDVVKAWAKSAATNVGLAKSEYADLAVVLGSMLKNNGMKEFTGTTANLIQKGADLAAQFGGSTKSAIEAISSLLRGERDPIERYGVSIKQADVNARLAAEGLDKLTGKAKKQAEQQAVLKLLNEQTASSYKAFSRESDTLAQKQQILGARWENMKAVLGERFLPVATKVVGWLADTVAGTNDTSKVLKKIGEIYGSYLTPIIQSAKQAWQEINEKINDATGSSTGMRDILVKIGKAAEKYAPIVGKKLGNAIEDTGEIVEAGIVFVSAYWKGLKKIGEFADKALGPLDELAGKIAKLDFSKLSPLGVLGGLLGRSGVDLPGSLGRGSGVGAIGGGHASTINLTTRPQFNLVVDVPALRSFIRMETRDEISRQVLHAGSTR